MKGGENRGWPIDLPAIALVTEGEAVFSGKGEDLALKRGESVFIPPGNGGSLTLGGDYTLYAASPGPARPGAGPSAEPEAPTAGPAPGGRR